MRFFNLAALLLASLFWLPINVAAQTLAAPPSSGTGFPQEVLPAPTDPSGSQGKAANELAVLQQQRASALAVGDYAAVSKIDQEIAATQAAILNPPQVGTSGFNPAQGGGNQTFVPGGAGGGAIDISSNPNRSVEANTAISAECYSCPFFNKIETIKNVWAVDLYWAVAPEIRVVMFSIIFLYITIMGLLILTDPGKAMDRGKKLMMGLFISGIVLITLSDKTDSVPLAWQVIRVIEMSALKLGALIVGLTISVEIPTADPGLLYQGLAQLVERQVFVVFEVAAGILTGAGWFGVSEAVARAVTALIMLLPYLFVIGVFFAFLVEAMFKFVAISALSPLLMVALIFGWSRAYVTASLRIMLGAFLTIVLASAAMGLTVAVVEQEVKSLKEIVTGSEEAKAEAIKVKDEACEGVGMWSAGTSGGYEKLQACNAARAGVDNVDSKAFEAFRSQYFMLVIIGFVSVLLHLQSKSLASNISGANDGPGAAAAVVAGAKMALGAGIVMGSKTLFGQGGLGGGIRDALGGGAGKTLAEKGLVGSAAKTAAGAVNSLRETFTQSPMAPGGGGGEGVLKDMAKAATDPVKKGGLRD